MKKRFLFLLLLFSCSQALAAHEITLDGGMIAETNFGRVGNNLQLGYRYDLTSRVSLYGGYATGGGASIVDVVLAIVKYHDDEFRPNEYKSVPLSLQFNWPINNNLLFARIGGSLYQVEGVTERRSNGQVLEVSQRKNGIGPYGAIGWRHYFGEKRNWSTGLVYQYFLMHTMHVHTANVSVGYRF